MLPAMVAFSKPTGPAMRARVRMTSPPMRAAVTVEARCLAEDFEFIGPEAGFEVGALEAHLALALRAAQDEGT